MKTIASNTAKYPINEHGLPEGVEKGVIDDQIAEIMANGKAKPGRILVVTFELLEKEAE